MGLRETKHRYIKRLAEEPKLRQQDTLFLEQTAAMIGVLIIALSLMKLLGMTQDQSIYRFILSLGMAMDIVSAIRDAIRHLRLMMWLQAAGALICAAGIIYLTIG